MQKSTLVVDDDETRRRQLVHALSRRGLRYLDVADAFGAMAALGRADFGAVIAAEGRRTLSLRGLCQLARRRHPDVAIFVIHRDGSDPAAIPGILDTPVEVIGPTSGADAVAAAVEKALAEPPPPQDELEWQHLPRTTEIVTPDAVDDDPTTKVPVAAGPPAPPVAPVAPAAPAATAPSLAPAPPASVDALLPDEPTERTERVVLEAQDTPTPLSTAPVSTQGPLLEGLLDGGSGPALLLGLFAQELTGRLVVKDGPAASTLYFYRGEPVWADDPLGDAGLHRRLVQKGRLAPEARIEAVAQGQLLGSLVQRGLLSGQQMHDFMRELVRDATLAVTTATSGAYRFEEDRKFLDVAPLLRVNPFGLILESRRKNVSPAQLLALANEIEDKYVVAGPGLGTSAGKLAPFVRGARLDVIIDGTQTVRQVLTATNLDQFMGTLVMLSLRDSKLVSFDNEPRPTDAGGVTLSERAMVSQEGEEVTLVDAEYPTEPPTSEDEAHAREQIFGLYMRLKPLTVPRQVLGVSIDADLEEIDRAYQTRMRELDPTKIPEGSAQQLLSARVEELRRKVTNAYQVLQLQVSSQSGPHVAADGADDKSENPF